MKFAPSIPWGLLVLLSVSGCFLAASSFLVVQTIRKLLRDTSKTSPSSKDQPKNTGTWTSPWRTKGDARLGPTGIVIVSCLCLVTVPITIALGKYLRRFPTYEIGDPANLVEVLQFDAASQKYEFHYKGIDFWMKLCEKPPFDPGDSLILFKYEDRGSCASLEGEWTAVLIRRNEHGQTDSEVNYERQR